ncbi:DUF695 domain-containing protein [Massilia violaceinigra]|uniref:DUF695 domain-containing protein n=1 Tax=Massilia violaceinigra TaxID=2045208 RepID=A0ABY4A4Q1_9BURK|nr:DUF695 domain-containing protein [Massilia violaceinigra]UOD28541.1 DUF695 domain-containing protein [Massilia violaceinigra]
MTSDDHLPLEDLNDLDDSWTIAEGTHGDGPMLVRINTSAKRWAGHPELGIRVGFAIPLNHPNPGGLPDAEENRVVGELEDRIRELLQAGGPVVHALAITTGTFKEFVFYLKNGECIGPVHEQLRAEVTSHQIQCMAYRDPEWDVYASFSTE